MYRLVIATNQYAGTFEHELFANCIKDNRKYHVHPYKSMIDNAVVVYYDNKPGKRQIENILIRLNKWSKQTGVDVVEVVLLDNAKTIIEKYV